ncbi:hypothetical protein OROMI_023070 [Orobanche minor]
MSHDLVSPSPSFLKFVCPIILTIHKPLPSPAVRSQLPSKQGLGQCDGMSELVGNIETMHLTETDAELSSDKQPGSPAPVDSKLMPTTPVPVGSTPVKSSTSPGTCGIQVHGVGPQVASGFLAVRSQLPSKQGLGQCDRMSELVGNIETMHLTETDAELSSDKQPGSPAPVDSKLMPTTPVPVGSTPVKSSTPPAPVESKSMEWDHKSPQLQRRRYWSTARMNCWTSRKSVTSWNHHISRSAKKIGQGKFIGGSKPTAFNKDVILANRPYVSYLPQSENTWDVTEKKLNVVEHKKKHKKEHKPKPTDVSATPVEATTLEIDEVAPPSAQPKEQLL